MSQPLRLCNLLPVIDSVVQCVWPTAVRDCVVPSSWWPWMQWAYSSASLCSRCRNRCRCQDCFASLRTITSSVVIVVISFIRCKCIGVVISFLRCSYCCHFVPSFVVCISLLHVMSQRLRRFMCVLRTGGWSPTRANGPACRTSGPNCRHRAPPRTPHRAPPRAPPRTPHRAPPSDQVKAFVAS